MKKISNKKQKEIDKFLSSPLEVGETLMVKKTAISDYNKDETKTEYATIESLDGGIFVHEGWASSRRTYHKTIEIKEDDIKGRYKKYYIGADPFDKPTNNVRPVAYQFSSIMHTLNLIEDDDYIRSDYDMGGIPILRCNWNPYVYDKNGNKEYYQRDFVWTKKDKQLLIESIYQGIDCGKILVRKRSWEYLEDAQKKGETELSFNDIVDGKQRLNAVKEFIEDKFKDIHGNFYSDLSNYAQNALVEHQLFSYAEMSEDTTDSEVIKQFLKMNFTGVPQSKEHINFVKSINDKF